MAIPSYVQSNGAHEGPGSFATLTCAYVGVQTVGNCNIVAVEVFVTSGHPLLPTITDTSGNKYICPKNAAIFNSTDVTVYALYVAFNIASSVANTVTVTAGQTSDFITVTIAEYSGATSVSAVDGKAASAIAGSGTSASSGNITPQGANELLIAACWAANGATVSATGSWTQRVTSGLADGLSDQLSVTGSYSSTYTVTSGQWASVVLALAAPLVTMTPSGGLYDSPITVSLSSVLSGASIYYTTDGSTPSSSSTLYSAPFVVVVGSTTVKAFAVNSTPINSPVTSCAFQIASSIVPTSQRFETSSGLLINAISGYIMHDPPSGGWYWYGASYGTFGVYVAGFQGANCYFSSDLRNWTFQSQIKAPTGTSYWTRIRVLYNAANNNYVLWMNETFAGASISGVSYFVYTSTSPIGPFTQFASYSTIDGFVPNGDLNLFLDNDGVSAYLLHTASSSGVLLDKIGISKLSSDYKSVDGVNSVYFTNSGASPFGQQSEGHAMCNVNGQYFWMASLTNGWTPGINKYCTSSNILSGWTGAANPFVSVVVPQTSVETAISVTPANTNAYDSQVDQILSIPGRNAFIYIGDRYETGLIPSAAVSYTANFQNYVSVWLPITFPTSTTLSITWIASWNLDTTFPTVSGSPLSATNLSILGSTATWTNNETGSASIYFDSSTDSSFISVTSTVLTAGATSFAITSQSGPIYRIRTVNANGTALSFQAQRSPGAIFNSFLSNCSSSINSISQNAASQDARMPNGLSNIYNQIVNEQTTYFRV